MKQHAKSTTKQAVAAANAHEKLAQTAQQALDQTAPNDPAYPKAEPIERKKAKGK